MATSEPQVNRSSNFKIQPGKHGDSERRTPVDQRGSHDERGRDQGSDRGRGRGRGRGSRGRGDDWRGRGWNRNRNRYRPRYRDQDGENEGHKKASGPEKWYPKQIAQNKEERKRNEEKVKEEQQRNLRDVEVEAAGEQKVFVDRMANIVGVVTSEKNEYEGNILKFESAD